ALLPIAVRVLCAVAILLLAVSVPLLLRLSVLRAIPVWLSLVRLPVLILLLVRLCLLAALVLRCGLVFVPLLTLQRIRGRSEQQRQSGGRYQQLHLWPPGFAVVRHRFLAASLEGCPGRRQVGVDRMHETCAKNAASLCRQESRRSLAACGRMRYKGAIEGLPDPSSNFLEVPPVDETICVHPERGTHAGTEEAGMFEAAQEQKQSKSNRIVVTIFVLAAAVAVGGVLYTMSKSGSNPAAPVTAAAAAPAAAGKADPIHDLRIVSARMEKDRAGTTAVWLVDINNRSKAYAYSSIQYETTY